MVGRIARLLLVIPPDGTQAGSIGVLNRIAFIAYLLVVVIIVPGANTR
jgi:hypothetical protein